jgi:hypothetical protein
MRCYRPVVNERLCPRCGAPAQPGGKVCEHCELPLDGPAAVRYNPAGLALPSPIQGHATVLVGVIAAVALLAIGAWFVSHGVGPFRSDVVSRSVDRASGALVVDVRVGNDGSRGGKARCQVRAVKPDGSLVSSAVQLTPTIPGHADLVIRLRGEGMADAHDIDATCG